MMTSASWTIRTRITAWYVLVLAAILTGFVITVFFFQYALLKKQMFHDEVQDVETVEGLLYFENAGQLQLQQNYFSHPQSHLLVDRLMEVRDLSGAILYRSPTLAGQDLGGASYPGEGSSSFDERTVRLADGTKVFLISHRHPVAGRQVLIRLGYSLAPLSSRMSQFSMILLIAMPVALVLAGIGGSAITRRAFRPINAMAQRAEQITASNLHDRLQVENENDEFGHMARVFNHLLERLEQAFAQLQAFTADAAHELRAPLASLRAAGELVIEQQPEVASYHHAISSMLEETSRLTQTIDGLLMLSKAEAQQPGESRSHFTFPTLMREVLNLLEVVLDEKGLSIVETYEGPPQRELWADRSLIRVSLLNVLHNASKFSMPGSTITVSYGHTTLNTRPAERLCIHDGGPGILTGEHERLFERFYTSRRLETASQSGTGLGLSIAKLAIDRSAGHIAFDTAISSGACCCIDLPLSVRPNDT